MANNTTKRQSTCQRLNTNDVKNTFSCSLNGDVLCIVNKKSRQPVMYVRITPYCDVLTNHMLALELMNTLLRYYRQVDADISMYRG